MDTNSNTAVSVPRSAMYIEECIKSLLTHWEVLDDAPEYLNVHLDTQSDQYQSCSLLHSIGHLQPELMNLVEFQLERDFVFVQNWICSKYSRSPVKHSCQVQWDGSRMAVVGVSMKLIADVEWIESNLKLKLSGMAEDPVLVAFRKMLHWPARLPFTSAFRAILIRILGYHSVTDFDATVPDAYDHHATYDPDEHSTDSVKENDTDTSGSLVDGGDVTLGASAAAAESLSALNNQTSGDSSQDGSVSSCPNVLPACDAVAETETSQPSVGRPVPAASHLDRAVSGQHSTQSGAHSSVSDELGLLQPSSSYSNGNSQSDGFNSAVSSASTSTTETSTRPKDRPYPRVMTNIVLSRFATLDSSYPFLWYHRERLSIDNTDTCFVCLNADKDKDAEPLTQCQKKHGGNDRLGLAGVLCQTRFHLSCLKAYNAGAFCAESMLKLTGEVRCPMHHCSSCWLQDKRQAAVSNDAKGNGELRPMPQCAKCYRAFHHICRPIGGRVSLVGLPADDSSGRMVSLPTILCDMHSDDVREKKVKIHLRFCYQCERKGTKEDPILSCKRCIRSFHFDCCQISEAGCPLHLSSPYPDVICNYCLSGEQISEGQMLVASYNNKFFACKAVNKELYPLNLVQKDKYGVHFDDASFLAILWCGSKDVFSIVPSNHLIPLTANSYNLLGKGTNITTNRKEWAKLCNATVPTKLRSRSELSHPQTKPKPVNVTLTPSSRTTRNSLATTLFIHGCGSRVEDKKVTNTTSQPRLVRQRSRSEYPKGASTPTATRSASRNPSLEARISQAVANKVAVSTTQPRLAAQRSRSEYPKDSSTPSVARRNSSSQARVSQGRKRARLDDNGTSVADGSVTKRRLSSRGGAGVHSQTSTPTTSQPASRRRRTGYTQMAD